MGVYKDSVDSLRMVVAFPFPVLLRLVVAWLSRFPFPCLCAWLLLGCRASRSRAFALGRRASRSHACALGCCLVVALPVPVLLRLLVAWLLRFLILSYTAGVNPGARRHTAPRRLHCAVRGKYDFWRKMESIGGNSK